MRTTRTGALLASAASWVVALAPGCGGGPVAVAPAAPRSASDVRELPAHPSLAVVARDGDPRAALALAVLTAGVDDGAGATVPVALAAFVEARLAARGLKEVSVIPSWDGYRVRALLPASGDAAPVLAALREALVAPVGAAPAERDAVQRKLRLLALRPLESPALAEIARCADAPASLGSARDADTAPPAETLERWRAASHGLGRVVLGATGAPREIDAVASAILDQPAWPAATSPVAPGSGVSGAPTFATQIYDASRTLGGAAARVSVLVVTPDPDAAVAAASLLGAREGPLARRLRALEIPATVRDVTATVRPGGGCVALSLEIGRAAGHVDPADETRAIATGAAVARDEASWTVSTLTGPGASAAPRARARPARLAGDPREAAELAAWWALVARTSSASPPEAPRLVIGLGPTGDPGGERADRERILLGEIDRASEAWRSAVVDPRTELEPGQGPLWLALASPCGTRSESGADAGLTALAVSALAEQARASARDGDPEISEWITADGVGLIARAAPRDGEPARALAARAADALGGALLAAAVDPAAIARARARLMALSAQDDDARSFATLAEALAPGRPSSLFPLAAGQGLVGSSDGAVDSRIAALRRGPLRLAVLGNSDAAETRAAVIAVDRWVPRADPTRPPRACATTGPSPPPRPGTYVAPPAVTSTAWLAIPLHAATSTGASSAAAVTGAALDGPDGLLSRALSAGLASSWSARVVGGHGDAPALVVHVAAGGRTLDAAVAQVRALLDHLRRGGFTDADRARAAARLADEELATTLTPRGRLLRLWHGEPPRPSADASTSLPSLAALRAFQAEALRDDALVIVAARPLGPTPTPGGRPGP